MSPVSEYRVRGVSQIKFTMSDSFLVFYDFDILSMIKRKNPFGFYCVILILNLSRLISPITILSFQNLSLRGQIMPARNTE